MKKCLLIASCLWLFSSSPLLAQTDWRLGGNTLSTSSSIGSNNNYSLIFKTNNAERARLTGAGLLGIGTTSPLAKLHVNSAAGQSPFRVQINGGTKLLVNSYGGLSIGGTVMAPDNGLFVNGGVNIGIAAPSNDYYKLNVTAGSYDDGAIKGSGREVGVYGYAYNESAGDGIGVLGNGSTIGVSGHGFVTGVEGYSGDFYGGYFYSNTGTGLFATTVNGEFAARFQGDTYTSGTAYQSSDQNIKKNIQGMSNALSIISKLKPKHYEFRNDGKYASLNLPKGNHYGLLAQDVEEVLPELVKETAHQVVDSKATVVSKSSADGNSAPSKPVLRDSKESITIKGVNYTEMIPLLIAAVQEQQQTINALTEKIAKLEAGNSTGSTIKLMPADLIGVSLEQNQPNPTNSNTTFRYTIPNDATAQILVYHSVSGKLVKTLQAPATGQVEMNAADLEAGTYIYTLVVNGKQTAAKQLVLAK